MWWCYGHLAHHDLEGVQHVGHLFSLVGAEHGEGLLLVGEDLLHGVAVLLTHAGGLSPHK